MISILTGTPVQEYALPCGRAVFVKREDLCSPYPGPSFSKMRGVYAHVAVRPEVLIGVLDTFHSKAGWAVASCCKDLGRECMDFFPVYASDRISGGAVAIRQAQEMVLRHRGVLHPLPAGRSAVLHHQARKALQFNSGGRSYYLMPNALKLEETVAETAAEVVRTVGSWPNWVVPASSGTIAGGVIRGLRLSGRSPTVWVHLGYSRPSGAVGKYLEKASGGFGGVRVKIEDEGYEYRDSVDAPTPFPCNPFYDAKTWLWLDEKIRSMKGGVLFWNIGS